VLKLQREKKKAHPEYATTKEPSQRTTVVAKELLLANANSRIAERRDWLDPAKHKEAEVFLAMTAVNGSMWYLFSPVLPCFWSFDKTPGVAHKHDGGKWLCGMTELNQGRSLTGMSYGVGKHYSKGGSGTEVSTSIRRATGVEIQPCVVYSIGSCNRYDFEKRVREVAPGCEIHTFDPTVPPDGTGVDYYDVYHSGYGLGGKDTSVEDELKTYNQTGKFKRVFPTKTLPTIMGDLGHDHVDFLKIDVEGYEWPMMDGIEWTKDLNVGQIIIELHPGFPRGNKKILPQATTAEAMNKIFSKLEDAGFYLISMEPVTMRQLGQVEAVFLHKDWDPVAGFL